MLHGYGRGEGTISAAISLHGRGVTVEIGDCGGQVPAGLFEAAGSITDMDPLMESGRGIGLIVALSSRIDHSSGPGGNRLTLGFDGPGHPG